MPPHPDEAPALHRVEERHQIGEDAVTCHTELVGQRINDVADGAGAVAQVHHSAPDGVDPDQGAAEVVADAVGLHGAVGEPDGVADVDVQRGYELHGAHRSHDC